MLLEPLEFTNGKGEVIDMGTRWIDFYKVGMGGRFMPPTDTFSEDVPGQDGARMRGMRFQPRVIDIDVTLVANSRASINDKLRALARSLSPKNGIGTLKVTLYTGEQYELACILVGGLEGMGNGGEDDRVVNLSLTFKAFDPYWYATDSESATFTGGTPTSFFPWTASSGAALFSLSSSTVLDAAAAHNAGDVETWPQWTIKGPGSDLILLNNTTGKSLTLAHTLAAGDIVLIDTSPGAKSVIDAAGTNLYAALDNSSSLWALAPGDNDISITMSGTSSATEVTLEWVPRYVAI